jgi:hypothetical protein
MNERQMHLGEAVRPPPPEAHARRTDPETSHEAAAGVRDITAKQAAVLYVMKTRAHGLHLAGLVDLYQRHFRGGDVPKQSESGIRSRAAELVDLGKLVVTGEHFIDPMTGRRHRILNTPQP